MAQQKYKPSKARSRRRRSLYWQTEKPNLAVCPSCGAAKLPHIVCPECGSYKGKKVVIEKVKAKKEDKNKA